MTLTWCFDEYKKRRQGGGRYFVSRLARWVVLHRSQHNVFNLMIAKATKAPRTRPFEEDKAFDIGSVGMVCRVTGVFGAA